MGTIQNRRFANHLLIIAIILSVVLLSLGYYNYQYQKRITREKKYREIHAIAKLKSNQLSQWYQERLSEASFFSTSDPYPRYVKEILSGDSAKREIMSHALLKIMSLNRYENIFLLDTSMQIILQSKPDFVQTGPILKEFCDNASVVKSIITRDFYFCEKQQKIYLDIIAPILFQEKVIANLVFRIDPKSYLYPMISEWPVPSKTAESLIIRANKDKVSFLSTLQHLDNSRLNVEMPLTETNNPAVHAALQDTGLFEGIDYHKIEVTSDIMKIPSTNWYMISKIDQSEVYRELNIKTILLTIIIFLILFIVIASTAWIYNTRQRNILQELLLKSKLLYQSQVEFGATLNSIDNGVITTDVDGIIRIINPAAEKITGWSKEDCVGKPLDEVFILLNDLTKEFIHTPVNKVIVEGAGLPLESKSILISKFGEEISIDGMISPVHDKSDKMIGAVLVFADKRKEQFQRKLIDIKLGLMEISESSSLHDLLVRILDEFGRILSSPIGFFHFMEEDQKTLKLQAWSTFTSKYFCTLTPDVMHYPLDKAGIWADAARQKKTLVHNNYESIEIKNGLPEGHARLIREMVIPVIQAGKVTCIIGVGNKATEYSENDVEVAELLAAMVWEIVERKISTDNLKLSEEKYRLLTDNSIDAILLTNPSGQVLAANKAACEVFQWSEEEIILKGRQELVDLEDPNLQILLAQREKSGKARGELTFIKKDGSHFTAEVASAIFTNSFGEKLNSMIVRDLTEIKKAAQALENSEQNYRELINGMNETVWVISFEGNIIDTNLSAEKVFGYTKEEFIQNGLANIDANFEPEAIKQLAANMAKERFQCFETIHKRKDGSTFPVEIYSSLVNYNGQEVILSIARDITFRKQLQDTIIKNEETIRLLFDSTAEGIYGIDNSGNCTFINRAALKMLKFETESEIIGKNMHELIHHTLPSGEALPAENCLIYSSFKTGKGAYTTDEVFWKSDGTHFPVEYWSYPIKSNQQTIGSVVTFMDISRRKNEEHVQHLLYEIARTSLHSEDIPLMLRFIRHEVSNLLHDAQLYFYKFQQDEIIPFPMDEQSDEQTEIAAFLANQVVKREKVFILQKDEIKPLIELAEFQYSGTLPCAWIGIPLTKDQQLKGVLTLHLYDNSSTISQSTARMMEMIGNELTVVMERNQFMEDLVRMKEKAEESDTLKSAFLANMSHEIRTPMNGILGFIGLLAEPNLDEENRNSYMDIVMKSSKRLLDTINDIIEISKIESGSTEISESVIDLHEFLHYYQQFFHLQCAEKNISLNTQESFTHENSRILSDKIKLDSILTNLIKNAIKFTDKGSITIGTYLHHQEIVFYVKDTGKGISPEKMEVIFGRFMQAETSFSRNYEGSGLGLAISKAYVEALGGKIWVESTLGAGSTFFFSIPWKPTTIIIETTDSSAQENHIQSRNRTILIAEDDDNSYLYLQVLLKKENFSIIRAVNGAEAIEILKRNPSIFLILMDIKMAVMDGLQATQKIREFNKDIPIIAQTAYALPGDEQLAMLAGCSAYLSKPIKKTVLLNTISTLLPENNT